MKEYKVIILGCGAAGAMCALSTKEKSVAVIDSNTKVAKKLLATGNGRCNLTNTNVNSSFYNTNIDKFLKRFDNNQALDFFERLGLETYADEEGRVYPISNSAKSVVDVIDAHLKADLFLGEKIKKIIYENKKFVVTTEKETFKTEKLVVATGGNSKEILSNLGIKFAKFMPSLVALRGKETRDLNSAKISNVLVRAENCKGEIKQEVGEILFKEEGLSGIVVFNLSTLFSRVGDFHGKISIDLLPKMTEKALCEKLSKRRTLCTNTNKLFVGMFVGAVSNEIFKQAKTNINTPPQKLSDDDIKSLAKTIKNLQFDVCGAYDNNQVFAGGVPLSDLTDNLESKKIPNLYFVGEICDVDGVCGGYNLQWAWTSGHIVGESL